MAPLTREERNRIRSQITMSLANLAAVRFFWHPARRRLIARSESVQRRFRVPEGAILVGLYEGAAAAIDALTDLTELIESVPEPEPAPEPEPLPPITALEWLYRIAPTKGSTLYAANACERRRDSFLGRRSKAPPASVAGAGDAKGTRRGSPPPSHPWRASSGS